MTKSLILKMMTNNCEAKELSNSKKTMMLPLTIVIFDLVNTPEKVCFGIQHFGSMRSIIV